MSLVFSLLFLSAPLLSWGRDSLVLDTARLGITTEGASSSVSQWIYADVVVIERNTTTSWTLGLGSIRLGDQQAIDDFAKGAEVEPEESDEYVAGTTYYIGSQGYAIGKYKGPWGKMENLLARLAQVNTVPIRDSLVPGGPSAVYGDLYCGSNAAFRSASGTFNLAAPAASTSVAEYLAKQAQKRGVTADELVLKGILYLQSSTPLFFYVME